MRAGAVFHYSARVYLLRCLLSVSIALSYIMVYKGYFHYIFSSKNMLVFSSSCSCAVCHVTFILVVISTCCG